MKTTLIINDTIMRQLKQRAVQEKTTLSELVASALKLFLDFPHRLKKQKIPPLPSWNMGEPFVDFSNREALYQTMEAE